MVFHLPFLFLRKEVSIVRPIFLKLKGFKGIRSGSEKDEIELDFSNLQGLVALTGPNGAGKTTVLDNLHPYRIMPYRAGSYSSRAFSFYSECYGSDALKELQFEMNGKVYRSLILIDAERKRQEAYLYERIGDGWKPLCSGGTDEYDRVIEGLAGSPELFFTGVFRCQDAPRLCDYTKGEIKDVFVELLGIEALKQMGDKARELKNASLRKAESLAKDVERLSIAVKAARKAELDAAAIEKEVEVREKDIFSFEKNIESLQACLSKLQVEASMLEKALGEKKVLEEKAVYLKTHITRFSGVLARATEIRAAVEKERALTLQLDLLRKNHAEADSNALKLQEELTRLNDAENRLGRLRKVAAETGLKKAHRIESLKKDLKMAQESTDLLNKVPCGNDLHGRCPLLKNAIDAKESIPGLIQAIHLIESRTDEEDALMEKIKPLEAVVVPIPHIQKRLSDVLKKKQEYVRKISEVEANVINLNVFARLLPELELAEKTVPGLETELKGVLDRLDKLKDANNPQSELDAAVSKLKTAQEKKRRLAEEISRLKLELGAAEALKKQGQAASVEFGEAEIKMKVINEEASAWALLEKAFGNDGIVALEIDEAGPEITAMANDLLQSCFGPRFSVRIDTQAVKADGKGLKETFDVTVFDTERSESKSLRTMSGGEKVWIEEAVTRAISLYNACRSGRGYRALFTDEKDGALDFRRKKEFMAMKRRVLKIGGYDVEFFISQSPEIQEAADHRIDLL